MALGYFEGETHWTPVSASVLGGQLVANSDITNYSQRPYFSLMFNAKTQQRKCDPAFLPQRCLSLHHVLSWAMWAFHSSDVPSKKLTTVTLTRNRHFKHYYRINSKCFHLRKRGKLKSHPLVNVTHDSHICSSSSKTNQRQTPPVLLRNYNIGPCTVWKIHCFRSSVFCFKLFSVKKINYTNSQYWLHSFNSV